MTTLFLCFSSLWDFLIFFWVILFLFLRVKVDGVDFLWFLLFFFDFIWFVIIKCIWKWVHWWYLLGLILFDLPCVFMQVLAIIFIFASIFFIEFARNIKLCKRMLIRLAIPILLLLFLFRFLIVRLFFQVCFYSNNLLL